MRKFTEFSQTEFEHKATGTSFYQMSRGHNDEFPIILKTLLYFPISLDVKSNV